MLDRQQVKGYWYIDYGGNSMIRVTGSSSLLMTPLQAMEESAEENSVSDILTGNSQKSNAASAITTNGSSAAYKSIQTAVKNLTSIADKLKDTSESSLQAGAAASGSTADLVTGIKDFVNHYNTMLDGLKEVGSSTTKGYLQEFAAITESGKSELAAIGITAGSDGKLSVDDSTLTSTSLDKLKEFLNNSNSTFAKIMDESVYAGASAAANSYMGSAYGTTGNYSASGVDYGNLVNVIGGYMDSIG